MRNPIQASPLHRRAPGALRRENHGSRVGITLAALTSVAVLGAIGIQALNRNSRVRAGVSRLKEAVRGHQPEVHRSLTIERPAEELYQRWSDPQVFRKIIGHFATVEPIGEDRAHWSTRGPLGQWTMRLVENRPNESMRWEPVEESAPLRESSVQFLPARGKPGTIIRLHFRLDPPHGVLGQAAARFMHNVIPGEIASKTLHYFKSLALTGEIPTTDRQPAARRDPR